MGLGEATLKYLSRHKTSTIMNVGFGISAYADAREEGKGAITSAAEAAFSTGAGMFLGGVPAFLVYGVAPMTGLAVDAVNGINTYGRQLDRMSRNVPFSNSHFVDFKAAHTMRQAGMNLAAQSRYSVQQAMLGNEAKMINR